MNNAPKLSLSPTRLKQGSCCLTPEALPGFDRPIDSFTARARYSSLKYYALSRANVGFGPMHCCFYRIDQRIINIEAEQ